MRIRWLIIGIIPQEKEKRIDRLLRSGANPLKWASELERKEKP